MHDGHRTWIFFLAMMFVALSLGPSLAHLLELPNKIHLPETQYFIVQNIYRGWALLGVVVFGALFSTLALALSLWRARLPRILAFLAFACIVAAQATFWIWTYPANAATNNWTVIPDNWQRLRTQWEYSHAAGALLNLCAMGALIVAALHWKRDGREPPSLSTSRPIASDRP